MLDAAVKALAQMLTPPFRSVLARAVGLAVLILVLFAIGLHRLFGWLAAEGALYLEGVVGPGMHTPLHVLLWVVAIAAGLGLAAGAIFLMPAVSAFVATFFSDEIAAHVEHVHYPADPPGMPVPLARATLEGLKTAGLAFLVYLCALPFLLVAGLGVVIFFVATAYLLGREYFLLVAMRFDAVDDAKALRRAHRGTLFVAGLFIAAFVSIPIVNLATPLFGTAFMTHMHKRIAGNRTTSTLRDAPSGRSSG
jgi:CysZ protein